MAGPRDIERRYDEAMETMKRFAMAVGIGVLGTGLIETAKMLLLYGDVAMPHTWPFVLGLVAVGSILCWFAFR